VTVGYSDHTIGSRALEVAAAMGAEILEFHFTDEKQGSSFRDHQLSLEKPEVERLVRELDLIRTLKGAPEKRPVDIESESGHIQSFRRAVYPSRDIAAGEILEAGNLCVLRPNHGIDARDYDALLGRHAQRALRRHEPLDWCDIE
ncbi:MAG: N-acetylneuraminate synthase family protein, partial [Planctomycetota bacterium]